MSVEKNGKMEIDIKRYARVEKVCVCTGAHSCMQKQPSAHILSCGFFFVFFFSFLFFFSSSKIPGGSIEDSEVLDGVMLNKDIPHPKMRR